MEMRSFGRTGMQVGVLGFGAAEIGFRHTDVKKVDLLLGEAIDAGLNVIDTASMYLSSEEKIGHALRGRRNQVFLFTKCGRNPGWSSALAGHSARVAHKLRYRFNADDEDDALDWHPGALTWNIEQSLIRLQTDQIDLMQLHSCSEKTLRSGDVIEVLQRAREAGKVRHLGFSGDGAAALYAVQCGQFDALQTSINIADQEALEKTIPLACDRGIGVIAKRPVANGLWRQVRRPHSSGDHAYWGRLQDLRYELTQNGNAFETALRFTLGVPGVSTAIVGTTNLIHFRQNARFAAAGALGPNQYEAIRTRWQQVSQCDWVGQV